MSFICCVHDGCQYLQFSLIPFEYLIARQSSYLKYSASIQLFVYSCRLRLGLTITKHRLISLTQLLLRQNSAPSLTTLVIVLNYMDFQSSFSGDFQQIIRLSAERQINLLLGFPFLELCFNIRYPFFKFVRISWIDSDYELQSLRLLLVGEDEGELRIFLLMICTSPRALTSTSFILLTLSAVLEAIAFIQCLDGDKKLICLALLIYISRLQGNIEQQNQLLSNQIRLIKAYTSLLGCLGLPCIRITICKIINSSSQLLIAIIHKPNICRQFLNTAVKGCTGVFELRVESILHKHELNHDNNLYYPSHEVKPDSGYAIDDKGNLNFALSLVHIVLIVANNIKVRVDRASRKLQSDEFDDIEGEKQDYWSVVKIVDEAQRSNSYIENILSMVVHEHSGQVLFVHLWSFQHTIDSNHGCQQCHHEGVRHIEQAHHQKEAFQDGLNDVDEGDLGC